MRLAMADITAESAPPRGEVAVLVGIQSALARRPGALAAARALSHFGEHSLGWLVVAATGAALQPARRRSWLVAGGGAFAAHAAAVVMPLPVMLVPPMALSRMLLGVHYPSDVAAGVAVGLAVATATEWVAARVDRRWPKTGGA
jgi:membrane-associated phospholipid phosphatase